MIAFSHMPGYGTWGNILESLLGRRECLWVYGQPGSGVSTVGSMLAQQRNSPFLDDADLLEEGDVQTWIKGHPGGVLGAHRPAGPGYNVLELRLGALDEDPWAIMPCLEEMAAEEHIEGPMPPLLGHLPCPGELRGLKNRLLRWKFMGQLPDPALDSQDKGLPLEIDNFATNLHALEKILLYRALRRSYGNRMEAAERLGISRRQLYLLIGRHGDPVRGEAPTKEGPKRLGKARMRQNSS